MLLGCIADDFTGASDLGNTLAKGGMATVQFIGTPLDPAPADCEAGVIALKTRSATPSEAVAQSAHALEWLRRQGCRQFLFKYCSTFDSTHEGNIGPVADALLDALGQRMAVVCPVFPAAGRTLFMGHLFVGDHLLSESGMEKHPLNPMTDPDIKRWLRWQTRGDVGLVPYGVVREGPVAIRAAVEAEAQAGRRLVVVDAVVDDDLRAIGEAVADHVLVTGGSGIALGLPRNFQKAGLSSPGHTEFPQISGLGVVFSGSCSSASRSQVSAYQAAHPSLLIEPEHLSNSSMDVERAIAYLTPHLANTPIVYSSATPADVAQAQARFGKEAVARSIEAFFAELASHLLRLGVRRFVVGGGETAGAVVTALGVDALRIGPEIDPGVPALVTQGSAPPLGLALKSGNFGSVDFFAKAMRLLEAA